MESAITFEHGDAEVSISAKVENGVLIIDVNAFGKDPVEVFVNSDRVLGGDE